MTIACKISCSPNSNQWSAVLVMRGWTGGSDDSQCHKQQINIAEWALMIWTQLSPSIAWLYPYFRHLWSCLHQHMRTMFRAFLHPHSDLSSALQILAYQSENGHDIHQSVQQPHHWLLRSMTHCNIKETMDKFQDSLLNTLLEAHFAVFRSGDKKKSRVSTDRGSRISRITWWQGHFTQLQNSMQTGGERHLAGARTTIWL